MQKPDMGVPRYADVDAETQGMIFRKTKVVRSSFIHEGEAAGRICVPGIRRNYIQSGLQLGGGSGLFFGLLLPELVFAFPDAFSRCSGFMLVSLSHQQGHDERKN